MSRTPMGSASSYSSERPAGPCAVWAPVGPPKASYDLGRLIEHVPDEKPADLHIPDIDLAVYPRDYIIDRIWGETFVVAPRTRIEYEPPPIPDELAVPPDPRPIDPLAPEDFVHTIE